MESKESFESEMEMESPDAHRHASDAEERDVRRDDAGAEPARSPGFRPKPWLHVSHGRYSSKAVQTEMRHQSKAVQTEPTEEELEEEIEVDDAQCVNYWELSEAFQPSLRAPLLTRAQPSSDDEVPQQVSMCAGMNVHSKGRAGESSAPANRWPFISQ